MRCGCVCVVWCLKVRVYECVVTAGETRGREEWVGLPGLQNDKSCAWVGYQINQRSVFPIHSSKTNKTSKKSSSLSLKGQTSRASDTSTHSRFIMQPPHHDCSSGPWSSVNVPRIHPPFTPAASHWMDGCAVSQKSTDKSSAKCKGNPQMRQQQQQQQQRHVMRGRTETTVCLPAPGHRSLIAHA